MTAPNRTDIMRNKHEYAVIDRGGVMLNIIRQFLAKRTNKDWTETQWVAVDAEPSIYPLILAHGNYLVTVDEVTDTWHDVTPIVNEDSTITLTHQGHIIGHINHYETIGRT